MFLNVLNWLVSILGGLGGCIFFLLKSTAYSAGDILKCVALGLLVFVIVYICFFILIWLFFIFIACTINCKKEYTKSSEFYNYIFVLWYRYICAFSRVKIHTSGMENLPKNQKYLTVCNHRSSYDNFVQTVALRPEKIAYITKPENYKIPLAGAYMRRGLYLSIDRENVRNALKTIMKGIEYIDSNLINIGVFPEGTRSKTGELGVFKPGCLKVAEKAECPIVVFTVQGTELVRKNFPWKKTDVYLDLIKVIQPEEFENKTTVDISDDIRNAMLKKLGK